MSEIAELSVKVTPDQGFEKKLTDQMDRAAGAVESRAKKMSERIGDGLEKAGKAASSLSAIGNLFDREAKKVEERSLTMTDRLKENFASIGAGLVGGLAFERSVAQFNTLEARAAEVFTLLPQRGQAAFDQLTQEVLAFQGEMRVATEEAVPALYQAISAGQTEDPFAFLVTAREAAIGGVTDLKTAVDALAGTVNAYNDPAVNAERVSDAFFTTVKLGVTTFGELAVAMPQVTATAAAFGITIEQAAAAVATLTQKGIDTQRATTFLNQAFVELAKSGTIAAEQFQELSGTSLQGFLEQGNTFVDVVELIATAADETGLSVIDMFGSVEAGRAILTLTNDGGEALASTFDQVQNSFGATAAAAEVMANTTEQTRQRIGALFQTAQQAFGAEVQPAIRELLLTLEELLPTVVSLASSLGGVFAIQLQLAVPAIKILAGALETLLKVLDALPVGLLAAVVAWRTFRNVFSGGAFILSLARNTALGSAALTGLGTAATAAAGALPPVGRNALALGRSIALASAAVPVLSAALIGGVALWNRYQDRQAQAKAEIEAYGNAVRERATPQVEILSARVQGLIRDLELLDAGVEATEAKMAGLSETTAGFVGILNEAAVNDGLDESFTSRLRLAAEDLDALAEQAVLVSDAFTEADESFQNLGERNRNVAFLEFLRNGADTSELRAFAGDVIDLAVKAELTNGELETLVRSLATLGNGQSAFAQQLELGAIESLAEFRERGNEVVDAIVDQEIAFAQASGAALPMTRAVEGVEAALSELERTKAADALIEVADAQLSALDAFLSTGSTIDDLAEEFAGLLGPLAAVDNLLASVTAKLEGQFRLGETGRRAIQNLDAAYEDLSENLAGFSDETRLDELKKQLDAELEVQGGIVADLDQSAKQIRENFRVAFEDVFTPEDEAIDDYLEVIRNIQAATQAAVDEANIEAQREAAVSRLQQFGGFENLERAVTQGIADDLLKRIIDVPSAAAFGQIEREIRQAGGIDEVQEAFGAPAPSSGSAAASRRSQERVAELEAEIAAEEEAIRARREGLRSLDDFTDEGREAFNAITEYNEQVLENASIQLEMGASLGTVSEFLREQEALLFETAAAAGVSESALIEYQRQLDLTPDALTTLIDLAGADATVQDLSGILSSMDTIPDEVKAEILLLGKDPALEEILALLGPLGLLDEFKAEAQVAVDGDVDGLVAKLRELNDFPPEIPFEVTVDSSEAFTSLRDINEELLEINGYPVEIPFQVSSAAANTSLSDLDTVLSGLPAEAGVDVATQGVSETLDDIAEVQVAAETLDSTDPIIDVDALTAEAQEQIDQFSADLDLLDGRVVTTEVLVDFSNSAGGLPGFAAGGVFDVPGVGVPNRIGEDGREYAINVGNPRHRSRSEALLYQAARDLGMSVSRIGEGIPAATVSDGVPPMSGGGSTTRTLDVKIMKQDLDEASLARLLALDLDELFSL